MTLSIPTPQDTVPDSTPMALPGHDLPWLPEALEQRLRGMESRYHIHHPFNQLLNRGQLQAHQVRGWIANRFYYQACIPMKDAAILSNCPDSAFRRRWIDRLLDHDGRDGGNAGGIEAWIRLGQAAGIARESMLNFEHVLPAVRFAVDAYVNFARTATWQEAAISSLTELFAPRIHADRLAGWPQHYPWIAAEGLDYFRSRIPLASRDVEHGLEVAKSWCTTRQRQERAVEILQFKLDILWAMLDAIERAYPQAQEGKLRP